MPKNKLFLKLKEDKGARAIAITVTVMLLVLTAIIVTTVIANRAAKDVIEPPADIPADNTDVPVDNVPTEPDPVPETPSEDEEKPQLPPVSSKPESTDTLPSHFLLPVSGVLQKSHDATLQVFSGTMGDYRTHLGIDIGTVAGANVCAMADGVIAQVWEDFYLGQCVAIKHGGDALTIYKNLGKELPESTVVGRTVKAGDVIGHVGDSAMTEVAEEPHLHLEMTVNGLQVDPTEYFDEDAMATLNEDVNFEDVS